MLLITNNEFFKNAIKRTDVEVNYFDIDYIGILKKARDLIHQNYRLLTHPLYGSVKPNETVFRTVILEKCDEFDMDSLMMIEDCINTATKFMNISKPKRWTPDILDDFRVVDYDIISQTLERIY
ncbi:GrdX family protein [uncultured Finegoldia sp.]|uniref:GrdX family protein n=1 Tax=uncultured Finegoldia sp. TaxID=328009 RepID=UPI00260FC719|nr:GrdX family protein [uncultured Finegoldia sp.]